MGNGVSRFVGGSPAAVALRREPESSAFGGGKQDGFAHGGALEQSGLQARNALNVQVNPGARPPSERNRRAMSVNQSQAKPGAPLSKSGSNYYNNFIRLPSREGALQDESQLLARTGTPSRFQQRPALQQSIDLE